MLYILVSQGADKLPDVKLWGLKKNLVWANSNTTDLLSKSVFECARKRFFIKPQLLTSGSLSAPWDTRMLNTSFERSIFFLQHKILKRWFAALLTLFRVWGGHYGPDKHKQLHCPYRIRARSTKIPDFVSFYDWMVLGKSLLEFVLKFFKK